MTSIKHTNNSGFTLIELAMVVLVVALVIGGGLTAGNLAADAKLKRIGGEVKDFVYATNTFEKKYLEVPGDISNAHDILGNATHGGDGDGHLEWQSNDGEYEALHAWEHLALAELIPNVLNVHCGASNSVLGGNVPFSTSGLGGFYFSNEDSMGNFIGFGRADNSGHNDSPALTVSEARQLDEKLDDGNAATGSIRAQLDCLCANYDGSYVNSNTDVACIMKFSVEGS